MNRPDDVDFGFDVPTRVDLPSAHWKILDEYATAHGTTVAAMLRSTAVHILDAVGPAVLAAPAPRPVPVPRPRPVPVPAQLPAPVPLPVVPAPDEEPAAAQAGPAVVTLPSVDAADVRRLHAQGLNDSEIAAELGCTPGTAFRLRNSKLGLPKNVTGRPTKQQRTA